MNNVLFACMIWLWPDMHVAEVEGPAASPVRETKPCESTIGVERTKSKGKHARFASYA